MWRNWFLNLINFLTTAFWNLILFKFSFFIVNLNSFNFWRNNIIINNLVFKIYRFTLVFRFYFHLLINLHLIIIFLFDMFILTFIQFEFIIFLFDFSNIGHESIQSHYLDSIRFIKYCSLLLKILSVSDIVCPFYLLLNWCQ